LLVLRDSEGHVFGAYSPVPLECSPRFTGNSEAFLFRLQPELHVYPDAGVNSNYVYFNYGTSTLPNGIGFGGQMNYFGLWIDSSFTFGSCAASPRSTTFNSPRLNSPVSSLPSPKFEIDAMHVYLVHPKEVDDRLVPERVKRGGRGSILNSHPIESALLEMAGKERYA
ncbi:TLD-domain-containing protein, partial [Chytriomyces sp. MP71]